MLRSGLSVINLRQIKKSVAYSQGLRIKRLCSSSLAFEKHLESIPSWFGRRGYPKKFVDNQLKRVVEHQTKNGTGVPLVVAYHPRFHNLGRIIRKNFIYLYTEEQVKQVFTPAPMSEINLFSNQRKNIHSKTYYLLS